MYNNQQLVMMPTYELGMFCTVGCQQSHKTGCWEICCLGEVQLLTRIHVLQECHKGTHLCQSLRLPQRLPLLPSKWWPLLQFDKPWTAEHHCRQCLLKQMGSLLLQSCAGATAFCVAGCDKGQARSGACAEEQLVPRNAWQIKCYD
jgi:hypothetical protein